MIFPSAFTAYEGISTSRYWWFVQPHKQVQHKVFHEASAAAIQPAKCSLPGQQSTESKSSSSTRHQPRVERQAQPSFSCEHMGSTQPYAAGTVLIRASCVTTNVTPPWQFLAPEDYCTLRHHWIRAKSSLMGSKASMDGVLVLVQECVFFHLKYLPSQYLTLGKVLGTGWMHGYVCQVHPPFINCWDATWKQTCVALLSQLPVSGGLVRAGIGLC